MNIYLIESNSWVLLEEQIKQITKSSTNIITYNAEESTLEDILSEASYVSMFGEMKYLIVKNANYFSNGKLKEKEEEQLLKYLEQPYPLCTILFTTYEPLDGRKKITKQIKEKYQVILIPSPKGLELYNKVAERFIELKYIVEKDTINYIIHSCLGNYDLIYQEIEKLSLYYEKPTKIKLETVKQIISKTMVDNNFKFVDAVITKDLKKSLQYLNDLEILKVEPISLINLLAREYRYMLLIKKMEEKKPIGEKENEKTLDEILQVNSTPYKEKNEKESKIRPPEKSNDLNEEVDKLLKLMKKINKEEEAKEEKEEALKDSYICESCGSIVPRFAKKCLLCGSDKMKK